MRHVSFLSVLVFGLLSSLTQLYASEVLVVTWQGKAPTDVSFLAHLKKINGDVTFKYIDAGRDKSKLAKQLRSADLSKTDVVYSFGTTGTKIVKKFIDGKKPIVFNIVSLPVLSKIANSIEKPGNNLTGAKFLVDQKTQIDILAKVKKVKKLAIWFDPREKQNTYILKELTEFAKQNGMEVSPFRLIPDAADFESSLKKASEEAKSFDALYLISSSSYFVNREKLHKYMDPKLLVMAPLNYYVSAGSTIAMGVDDAERGRAAAELVNKVLKGASAGDIPISVVKPKEALLYVNKAGAESVGLRDLDKLGFQIKYISSAKK